MAARLESDYLLLRLPGHQPVLVLGMRWHTILGSGLERRARLRARQAGASHYAHDGRSEAVGVLRLARRDRRLARGRGADVLHSAALAFAAEHRHGMAALCARLPDGRAWVVACQAGKVLTQSDRIHASPEEARAAIGALRERYGETLAVHGLDDGDAFDFSAMAEQARAAQRLRSCGYALPAAPRPLLAAVLLGAMTLAGREAWQFHRMRQRAEPPPAAAVDGRAAWAAALESYGRDRRLHTRAGWTAVLAQLAGLPVVVGGWRLQSAQCLAAARGWNCEASYRRAARQATNDSFAAAWPQAWRPAWRPLDGVLGRFAIADAGSAPLAPDGLATLADHERATVTALQTLLPALSRVAWGDAAPARIEPPRAPDGTPVPRPAGLPAMTERPLTIEGPLRSLFLLPDALSGQVRWRSVSLAIEDAAPPSLNRSRLMAGMSGVLYARD